MKKAPVPRAISAEMRAAEIERARHRQLFAELPEHPAKQALRVAMLMRAFWLLEEGDRGTKAADGLLEFMSEKDVAIVLERFFETSELLNDSDFPPPTSIYFNKTGGMPGYAWADGRPYRMGSRSGPRPSTFRRVDWKVRARRQRSKIHSP